MISCHSFNFSPTPLSHLPLFGEYEYFDWCLRLIPIAGGDLLRSRNVHLPVGVTPQATDTHKLRRVSQPVGGWRLAVSWGYYISNVTISEIEFPDCATIRKCGWETFVGIGIWRLANHCPNWTAYQQQYKQYGLSMCGDCAEWQHLIDRAVNNETLTPPKLMNANGCDWRLQQRLWLWGCGKLAASSWQFLLLLVLQMNAKSEKICCVHEKQMTTGSVHIYRAEQSRSVVASCAVANWQA